MKAALTNLLDAVERFPHPTSGVEIISRYLYQTLMPLAQTVREESTILLDSKTLELLLGISEYLKNSHEQLVMALKKFEVEHECVIDNLPAIQESRDELREAHGQLYQLCLKENIERVCEKGSEG